MADNLTVTPGSGATVAADEIAGVLYQRIKVGIGADGSATDLAYGQALMASSLPVAIASNQSAVPVSGTVSVTGVATQTTLSALNDKVSSRTTGAVQSVNIAVVDASGNQITSFGGGGSGPDPSAPILHRSSITSVDKLSQVGTVTLSGQTGGSLVSGTTYYVTVSAYNRFGNATPATIVNASPGGGNSAIRASFAQVTNADGYDIFLSTISGGPAWVGRITESQRASGIIINAVGSTTAGGVAGAVDIRVTGTGLASNAPPFTFSNAYTPALVTPIDCSGFETIRFYVDLSVTDLRSLPSSSVIPFFQNSTVAGNFNSGNLISINPLQNNGSPLLQIFDVLCSGNDGVCLLIDSLSGQGTAVSVYYQLF